jgi:hypothetical protein
MLIPDRLLVVGNQTASLILDPSFAHNLGYKCPNGQCKAIFDIYASRPFQWHQEHLNARCFRPCCRTLNIRESQRTRSPHFFQVLGFTPTLGQCRVATIDFHNYVINIHNFIIKSAYDSHAHNSAWLVHVISMGTSWIFSIHVITYVYDLKINKSFRISQALNRKNKLWNDFLMIYLNLTMHINLCHHFYNELKKLKHAQ